MLLRRLIGGHTLKRATCRGFSSASGPPAISSTANWEPEELEELRRTRPNHTLLPVGPDFQCAGPIATPRFNMAAYVNQSELLQQMVKLGVAIHKWDRMEAVHGWILQKDYSSQVEPVIRFLADVGVRPDDLGAFFSKNPSILKESLEDLEVRHNYLLSKKFDREQIGRIITRNPYWLLFRLGRFLFVCFFTVEPSFPILILSGSTTRIDDRLGFFQKVFQLSGPEVRLLAAKEPRLITSKLDRVKVMTTRLFGLFTFIRTCYRCSLDDKEDSRELPVGKKNFQNIRKQGGINQRFSECLCHGKKIFFND